MTTTPGPPFAEPIDPASAAPAALPYAARLADQNCPICGRAYGRRKPVYLYGFRVCHGCRNAFANRRQAAFLIDILLLWIAQAGVVAMFFLVLLGPPGASVAGPANRLLDICTTILSYAVMFTFTFRDAVQGTSPGKWLCGVQVVDRTTREPIGPGQSIKRNLPTLLPLVGILVPVIQMMNGPRWGDGWANSVVIWWKYRHKPPFDPRGICCLQCGYDLTGNTSGVCPECGHPIPNPTQRHSPRWDPVLS